MICKKLKLKLFPTENLSITLQYESMMRLNKPTLVSWHIPKRLPCFAQDSFKERISFTLSVYFILLRTTQVVMILCGRDLDFGRAAILLGGFLGWAGCSQSLILFSWVVWRVLIRLFTDIWLLRSRDGYYQPWGRIVWQPGICGLSHSSNILLLQSVTIECLKFWNISKSRKKLIHTRRSS